MNPNSSASYLSPPVAYLPADTLWSYNPLPFDPDGDSLVWSLTTPLGSSSTVNLVNVMDKIEQNGINVKIISAISEELFNHQTDEYKEKVLSNKDKNNCMVITTGTKRVWPVSGLGQLTEEYSLTSDFDDQWLTGGTEDDVIKEAKLDESSILEAVSKFANDYDDRMKRLNNSI